MFPDYLSFSCDYDLTKVFFDHNKKVLLILQTSGKTSAYEWDEWRQMRDQCRWVNTIQRQMRDQTSTDEWRRMRGEFRRMQTNERRVLFYHSWIQSLLLFLLQKEHVNLRSSLAWRTLCCVLIFFFLIHSTNARFIEHDNAQATKN